MATSKSTRPRITRVAAGNVLEFPTPQRPAAQPGQVDQYRQDIWDSFPHLRKPARMLAVHPYFEQE